MGFQLPTSLNWWSPDFWTIIFHQQYHWVPWILWMNPLVTKLQVDQPLLEWRWKTRPRETIKMLNKHRGCLGFSPFFQWRDGKRRREKGAQIWWVFQQNCFSKVSFKGQLGVSHYKKGLRKKEFPKKRYVGRGTVDNYPLNPLGVHATKRTGESPPTIPRMRVTAGILKDHPWLYC